MGPHESMTCRVHGIYLKFGSFNGIDTIVLKKNKGSRERVPPLQTSTFTPNENVSIEVLLHLTAPLGAET
jgi:hypothetical protein